VFSAVEGISQQLIVSADRADFGWGVVDSTGWPAPRLSEAVEEAARIWFDLATESRSGTRFSASPTRSMCC
jgi:hypothetical protein